MSVMSWGRWFDPFLGVNIFLAIFLTWIQMNFLEIPQTSTVVEHERKNTYLYFMSFYLSLSILKKNEAFLGAFSVHSKKLQALGDQEAMEQRCSL